MTFTPEEQQKVAVKHVHYDLLMDDILSFKAAIVTLSDPEVLCLLRMIRDGANERVGWYMGRIVKDKAWRDAR